ARAPGVPLGPRRDAGQIVDFQVEYVNSAAREVVGPAATSATLLAVYPYVGSHELLPAFTRVLRDGLPVHLGPLKATDDATPSAITARASRLWDRVLMVWRVPGEAELIY